jgi:hypothetical protein
MIEPYSQSPMRGHMSLEHSPAKSVRRYSRTAASDYLLSVWGISRTPNTLAKEAVTGNGPVIEYDGRIPLYPEDGLDAFARSRLSPRVRSPAERRAIERATPE